MRYAIKLVGHRFWLGKSSIDALIHNGNLYALSNKEQRFLFDSKVRAQGICRIVCKENKVGYVVVRVKSC